MRTRITTLLLTLLLGFAGCFETKLTLASHDDAKVDPALCGNWEIADPDAPADRPKVQMAVRNVDGKHYFVMWSDPAKPSDTLHMIAWTGQLKGVTFAHVRNMPADGSLQDKHLIVRFELKDDKLTMRQLNDKFFEGKPETDADLRKLVEENLENSEMYDEGEVVATKLKS